MTTTTKPINQFRPIDWAARVRPERHIPTNEEIMQMFSPEKVLEFAYISQFLGYMCIHYCTAIVCYYARRHRLDFKRQCRELRRCCEEFSRSMSKSVSIETGKWCQSKDWEFVQTHKFGCIELLKWSIVNDIKAFNPDCEDMDVAYGIQAALAMIEGINSHGRMVTAKVAEHSDTDPEFKPSGIVLCIKALLTDMGETLGCLAPMSQPTLTGIKVLQNKFIEMLK